jgi:hypothetical protein
VNRQIGHHIIDHPDGRRLEISTVRIDELSPLIALDFLLGLRPNGEPFETMVFLEGHRTDLYVEHYDTLEMAVDGHVRICDSVRAGRLVER